MTRSTSISASATTKSKRSSTTRRSKYGNVQTVVGGIKFHSKTEAARWKELQARAAAGRISGLERQVSFPITWPGTSKPFTTYICDFTYYEDGVFIVEDVKGKVTDVYRLKKKLLQLCYGAEVREVYKRSRNGTYKWFYSAKGGEPEPNPELPRIE